MKKIILVSSLVLGLSFIAPTVVSMEASSLQSYSHPTIPPNIARKIVRKCQEHFGPMYHLSTNDLWVKYVQGSLVIEELDRKVYKVALGGGWIILVVDSL